MIKRILFPLFTIAFADPRARVVQIILGKMRQHAGFAEMDHLHASDVSHDKAFF